MSADGAFQSNEDITDYTDDDILVKRERMREDQLRLSDESDTYSTSRYSDAEEVMTRAAALDAVVKSGTFTSFDELMSNTKQVYDWLTAGAAGGPETAQEEGTQPDLP